MSDSAPKTDAQQTPEGASPTQKIRTSAVIHAAVLTGLSFGAAIRAADVENGVVAGFAWTLASGIALFAAGDHLKSNGLVRVGNLKPGAIKLIVRVGAMVGALRGVEHMVNNPDNMAAFGVAAAATLAATALVATTYEGAKPAAARVRKPGA